MKIIINGEPREVNAKNISELMDELSLNPKKTIAECNGQVIQFDEYPRTILNPEDRLELVQFVGGG